MLGKCAAKANLLYKPTFMKSDEWVLLPATYLPQWDADAGDLTWEGGFEHTVHLPASVRSVTEAQCFLDDSHRRSYGTPLCGWNVQFRIARN